MPALVHERFEGDWQTAWTGQAHNAYPTSSRTDGEHGLRILFRKGDHYGCDLRREVPPTRHVRLSYWLRVASDWASTNTGKTVGFADLRWSNLVGQTLAHGNRPPRPNGFSFRTWFGKTINGALPIGIYCYHAGQNKLWGDSIPVAELTVGAAHVLVEVEADLDAGFVKMRVDDGDWVSHPIRVGSGTAVTTAWLDGYYGGWRKAPTNMAMDVDAYRLDDLTIPASERAPVTLADELHAIANRVAVLEAA